MKNHGGTIILMLVLGLGALLIYIRTQLGDIAALCFLFYMVGFFTGIIAVALGGRLNDQGQHAFIQGLSQLKSIMAPSVREDARTRGYLDRASVQMLARGANAHKEPSAEEQALYEFYAQANHHDHA